MVDFNGFDKGVIGKKLPSDTTLNCMRKSELIDLLHLAEENHRVLAEAYKIAVDTSKCNLCPLHLDTKKVEDIRADIIQEVSTHLLEAGYTYDSNMGIGNNIGSALLEEYANGYKKGEQDVKSALAKCEKEQKGGVWNDNHRMP